MSLLRDIQSSAVDANEPISTLLRKCKILAVRLGNYEFKSWVDFELNGYTSVDDMPEYRIMSVSCKGHFSGGFGAAINNAEIPSNCIPKEYRENLYTTYMRQPISSLESLIKESKSGTVQEPWPANVTVHFGRKIYQGYNCMEAWKVIPINALVGVIDMIRNRVLNFVLEIESEDPQAGDAPLNSQPVADEKVQQIFHTHISGNVQNLATGSNHVKQHAINNEQNDMFNELLRALIAINDSEQSKAQIVDSVEEMRNTQGTTGFRGSYNNFMSIFSDHIQVYGPIVAPFLPALAAIVP
ncbi:hypothetical protein [Pseudoalteromonas rhizosphaerae]|uniref:AbiTii domain-containing protein n=1 Tax=Pseudoalteromonas rhizosphaerae TaxID=2518973 RepID=UPI00370459A4